jgi:hypothetical protein
MGETKTKSILLRGVQFDRTAECSCGARIRWCVTAKGANISIEASAQPQQLQGGGWSITTDKVHFANCPHADRYRRTPAGLPRNMPSERID